MAFKKRGTPRDIKGAVGNTETGEIPSCKTRRANTENRRNSNSSKKTSEEDTLIFAKTGESQRDQRRKH